MSRTRRYLNFPQRNRLLLRTVLVALLLAGVTAAGGTGCSSGQSPPAASYNSGLTVLDFDYVGPEGNEEVVTAAVWYPTSQAPDHYTYHGQEEYESEVALDAPVATGGGPFPLILFAHGAYGSGLDSAFLMEHLARHGYIAVAPDFIDAVPPAYEEQIAFARIKEGNVGSTPQVVGVAKRFVEDMSADRDFLFSYLEQHRLNHVTFLIDQMLGLNDTAGSRFNGRIDVNAVGACGHSLGGLTALSKVGGYPKSAFGDARISAALILSAPAYPLEQTLDGVTVPMMLLVGDNDAPGLHPELPRKLVFEKVSAPRYYAVLEDATHYAFGNSVCGDTPLNIATEETARAGAICRYGTAFFDRYLLDDLAAGETLSKPDPAFAYYAIEESTGEVVEWGEEPDSSDSSPGGIREERRKRRR